MLQLQHISQAPDTIILDINASFYGKADPVSLQLDILEHAIGSKVTVKKVAVLNNYKLWCGISRLLKSVWII